MNQFRFLFPYFILKISGEIKISGELKISGESFILNKQILKISGENNFKSSYAFIFIFQDYKQHDIDKIMIICPFIPFI